MITPREAKALVTRTPDREFLNAGEVFLACRSWSHAEEVVEGLRRANVYGRQPRSAIGVIVMASKLEVG